MNRDVSQMKRAELIEFLKDAKSGKIETGLSKVWYFIDGKIKLNDLKGFFDEVNEDTFIEKYRERDSIITFTEPDYNKYSFLKSKPFIQVNNMKTAKAIEKIIKNE